MKYFFSAIFFLIALSLVISPIVLADGTGIWKDTTCAKGSPSGGPTIPCDFCDGLVVAKNIIGFLSEVAFSVAVLMIVYGAVKLAMAGGSEERVTEGKKVITNAVIGLVIALAAWLIVNELLHLLSGDTKYLWAQITCT